VISASYTILKKIKFVVDESVSQECCDEESAGHRNKVKEQVHC
jgi:hypothetical protein